MDYPSFQNQGRTRLASKPPEVQSRTLSESLSQLIFLFEAASHSYTRLVEMTITWTNDVLWDFDGEDLLWLAGTGACLSDCSIACNKCEILESMYYVCILAWLVKLMRVWGSGGKSLIILPTLSEPQVVTHWILTLCKRTLPSVKPSCAFRLLLCSWLNTGKCSSRKKC